MRRMFFGIALSAVLTGSLVSPVISQTSSAPKSSIPPHLAKECAANIAKEYPAIKIVGPFSEGTIAAPLTRWLVKGNIVVIAAPTVSTDFGQINKRSAGCLYDVRDGALVFRRVASHTEFPPRNTRAPGDPP